MKKVMIGICSICTIGGSLYLYFANNGHAYSVPEALCVLVMGIVLCWIALLMYHRLHSCKKNVKVFISIFAALFVLGSTGLFYIIQPELFVDDVLVTMQCGQKNEKAKGAGVVIYNWIQDGEEKSANSLELASSINAGWDEENNRYLYINSDGSGYGEMVFRIPGGTQCSILLDRNTYCGIVEISSNASNDRIVQDLYAETVSTYLYDVPEAALLPMADMALILLSVAVCLIIPSYILASLLVTLWCAVFDTLFKRRKCDWASIILGLSSVLLPVTYILFLFTTNSGEISFIAIMRICIMCVIISLGTYIVIRVATRSNLIGYVMSVLLSLCIFSAGYIQNLLLDLAEEVDVFLYLTTACSLVLLVLGKWRNKLKVSLFVSMSILCFSIMLCGFSLPQSLNIYNQQRNSNGEEYIKTAFNTDLVGSEDVPNIYWIHADGMLGFDSFEKYFGDAQLEFADELISRGFEVNRHAYFSAGHFTNSCVPALLCPEFYDSFIQPTVESDADYDFLIRDTQDGQAVQTQNILSTLRYNTEIGSGLRKANYNISLSASSFVDFYFGDTDHHFYTPGKGVLCDGQNYKADNVVLLADNSKIFIDTFAQPLHDIYFELFPMKQEKTVGMVQSSEIDTASGNNVFVVIAKQAMELLDPPYFSLIYFNDCHTPFDINEYGETVREDSTNVFDYPEAHKYETKVIIKMLDAILAKDPDAIIIIQGDHGLHGNTEQDFQAAFGADASADELWNCVMSAVRIPEKYRNGEEEYAFTNPLNISRYLVNRFVGQNYEYLPANTPIK